MLVHQFLENSALRFPDKVALACDGRYHTYAEIDRMADYLAAFLMRSGIVRHDRVVILMENRAEAVIALIRRPESRRRLRSAQSRHEGKQARLYPQRFRRAGDHCRHRQRADGGAGAQRQRADDGWRSGSAAALCRQPLPTAPMPSGAKSLPPACGRRAGRT